MIENLDKLGDYHGSGLFSTVVKPENKYLPELSIEDPVLIASREESKFFFLKELLGEVVSPLNKELLKPEYLKKYYEVIDSNKDIKCMFYMPDMSVVTFDSFEQDDTFEEALKNAFGVNDEFWMHSKELPVDLIMSEAYCDLSDAYGCGELNEQETEIMESIRKSLEAISNCKNINCYVKLDIHEDQFLEDTDGRFICVDPVQFSENPSGERI